MINELKKILLFVFVTTVASPALACPDRNGVLDVNCDGKVEIIAFGDSITHGTGDESRLGYPGRLHALLPDTIVHKLGNPGEQTPAGRARAQRELPYYPRADYVIVLEGTNDYWRGEEERSEQNTRNNLASMVSIGESLGAVGLLANLTDIRRNFQKPWVRAVNRRIAAEKDLDFYSLGEGIISGDLIHPTDEGYQVIANYVATRLREYSIQHRPIDSDADGIYDFAEPRFGTNQFINDSDSDGINDGEEVFTFKSNPLSVDSDGDGILDAVEAERGTDLNSNLPVAPVIDNLEFLPRT